MESQGHVTTMLISDWWLAGGAGQQRDGADGGHHGGERRGAAAEVPGERDPQDQPQADGGRDHQEEVHQHPRHAQEGAPHILQSTGGEELHFICVDLSLLFRFRGLFVNCEVYDI